MSEATFIELVLYDDLRRELVTFLRGRGPDVRSTAALIAVVAPKCHATPAQLAAAARLLEAEHCREADAVLADLLLHPDVPAETLLRLAENEALVPALGHRAGPPELVELLAEKQVAAPRRTRRMRRPR